MSKTCDVLVIGAGIAGIMASITAAQGGCSVVLASKGSTFSGSSFYPGTWGLGLIGPENEEDQEHLVQSILTVGCGMAQEELVRSFVAGITPAIQRLRDMGVQMKTAQNQGQKDFIPCFDAKHRSWNGLLFESLRDTCQRELERLGVALLPQAEVVELLQTEGRVTGALFARQGEWVQVDSRAVVLATGGYGGLFQRRLTTDDVVGTGQALALRAGAQLINLEFLQMMPGYLSPCYKTIFNEKAFRYTRMTDGAGKDILEGLPHREELLELRSTHGPFTSRLASRAVDFRIMQGQLAWEQGVRVEYLPAIRENTPEFIRTYFDWLAQHKHLTWDDPIQMGMFAHAANGGICIDTEGFTGVPGLFSCGEVTGGMHGADRIGGLSTANGLVFGIRAGEGAAGFARQQPQSRPIPWKVEGGAIPEQGEYRRRMQQLMTRHAMVVRRQEGLEQALAELEEMEGQVCHIPSRDVAHIAASRRLVLQLELARAIVQAQLLRRESRGSHYRSDFPQLDQEMGKPIVVSRGAEGLSLCFAP